ncbi:hypothetical protein D3C86_1715560 [compost metagenome]
MYTKPGFVPSPFVLGHTSLLTGPHAVGCRTFARSVAHQLAPKPSNAEGESTIRVRPEPVAWEYSLITFQMDEAKLTALGADGWELVTIGQDTKTKQAALFQALQEAVL